MLKNKIMSTLIFIIIWIVFLFIIPCIIINFKDYKFYKKIYKKLPNYDFCINSTQVYGILNYNKEIEFVWFINSNSFQLTNGIYLHNDFFAYFDPYYLYWLLKYRRWFKKNIDLNTIENY